MPEPYFSRIGKVDFFGALIPGSYALLSIVLALTAVLGEESPREVWKYLESWKGSTAVVALLGVLLLVASYLVGSVLRVIRIDAIDAVAFRFIRWISGWFLPRPENGDATCCRCDEVRRSAERLLPHSAITDMDGYPVCSECCRGRRNTVIRRRDERRTWHELLFQSRFPYWNALRVNYRKLKEYKTCVPKVTLPSNDAPHGMAVFDYWKMVLCTEAPEAFAYTQSLEARVRMFAGMIWAGLLGLVCASFILCFPHNGSRLLLDYMVFGSLIILWAVSCVLGRVLAAARGVRLDTTSFLRRWLMRSLMSLLLGIQFVPLFFIFTQYSTDNPWHSLAWGLLAISLAFVWILGSRLRHVRGEEANQLFLAYLAHLGRVTARKAEPKP